jgi:hypothetical protein
MLIIAACGSAQRGHVPVNHHGASTHALGAAQRLERLRKDLPAGFNAPGHAVGPGAAAQLTVAPAASLSASQVHLVPLPPRAALGRAVAAVINEPDPLLIRPLFLSSETVRPGGTVIVAATHLGISPPHHDALFILQGPGGRYQRLVAVGGQVAAGVVTLPATLQAGSWIIAVEDLSQLGSEGRVLVDIAELSVS